MTTPTTNIPAECTHTQHGDIDGPTHIPVNSEPQSAQKRRASGIPIARRSPSLTQLSVTSATPKWRTGARHAVAPQPSVSVSEVHAEPEQVQTQDASRAASRVISASVAKRASRESLSRRVDGDLPGSQQSASMKTESPQRHLRSTLPESHLPVRTSSSKVRTNFVSSPSKAITSGQTRARSGSTASTTSIITQTLTTPAIATTSTSTPETLVLSPSTSIPGSATTTLQAASDLTTPSSVKSASWFTALKKSKNMQPTEDLVPPCIAPTISSTSVPMPASLSDNPDPTSSSVELPIALTDPISLQAQSLPILQIQPPTPALLQGPNMAPVLLLSPIVESNPASPSSCLSTSPPPPTTVAASTTPARTTTSVILRPIPKSTSTPVSPTSHSRSSTPPPASAIPAAKPKRSWFGSPSRPSTPASRPQSRAGSVPSSPSKPVSTLRDARAEEGSMTPTPPAPEAEIQVTEVEVPRPSTPPPVYPLALKLDVDTIVDRKAMRAASPTREGGLEGEGQDEEPPVYTATERTGGGAGKGKAVVTSPAAGNGNGAESGRSSQPQTHQRTSPSSVDDTVPSLPHTPTEASAGAGAGGKDGGAGGAGSRFVLSLPLLGRAKLPLGVMLGASGATATKNKQEESAVTSSSDSGANSAHTSLGGSSVVVAGNQDGQDTPTAQVSQIEPFDNQRNLISVEAKNPTSDAIPISGAGTAAETERVGTAAPGAGASWWEYVGWTAGAGASLPPLENIAKPEEVAVGVVAETTTDENTMEPTENVQPKEEPAEKQDEEAAHDDSHDGAAVNDETADGSQQVATWYAPWAWYSPSRSQNSLGKGTVGTPDEPNAQAPQSANDAPAGSDSQPVVNVPPPPEPDPPSPPAAQAASPALTPAQIWEPETTITSSLSSWAAFFTSRSRVNTLAGRTIEAREVVVDEDGCEVMEIDFEDEPAAPHAGPARGRTNTANAKGARSLTDRSRSASGNARKRSPASGDGGAAPNEGMITTTSTLTATTMTTTTTTSAPATRPSSPAPAYPKKPPAAPAPPNFVLPTWADTFFVAPRSVLPRPPSPPTRFAPPTPAKAEAAEGVFGKTIKFMGSVLFAKDAHTHPVPSAPTSPKSPSHRKHLHSASVNRPSRLARVASASSGVSIRLDSDESEVESEPELSVLERYRRAAFRAWGQELPKAWRVLDEGGVDEPSSSTHSPRRIQRKGSWRASLEHTDSEAEEGKESLRDVLRGCRRVVVIGIHGWFPGAMIRTVLGEPTGTSAKFAHMTEQALHAFEAEHGVQLDKITQIPLEGDGTIERRVEKLHTNLLANPDWLADLHAADAILVATHSQGSVVSTHLLDRLIREGHIATRKNRDASFADALTNVAMGMVEGGVGGGVGVGAAGAHGATTRQVQRVCCLSLCGIHLGPLRYLSSSTLVGPYLQYFESTAARQLFEFQNTESAVSMAYLAALENVVNHGTKIVYVASLNDQVVPIYSGLFTAVSHPLILRALYIDGDAYHSSDFLSNLLVLLLRIRNAGMSDSGLLAHLSEATAGSLNGVGHSTAYEEVATYSLAVKYLFLANEGNADEHKLVLEPFNATHERNDYEIPWALRDVIADERVAYFFGREIGALRDAFREWHPKTAILRDLKRKLQPIQRLPASFSSMGSGGAGSFNGSKL